MKKNDESLIHPQYRPDIDGLRAIAVLSVLGFHAFPEWISGGFTGVDIFFVISGFLISTIIYCGVERGTFSFAEFYGRRIRRIFPALLAVFATALALGWVVLLADEYKQLGKHVAGGAGFVANFVFWGESGYFESVDETKPLLHLWSLGVEEQFYIVWPLSLWLAWKTRINLLAVTIIVFLGSFALNIDNPNDVISNFYSPQTRFWELLAGSLWAYVALHKERWTAPWWRRFHAGTTDVGLGTTNALSLLGISLIASGFFLITKELPFPGYFALLPVLGSVLIIGAGANAWFNRRVLSNRVLVWFGLISFPLYLWHWLFLSFAQIMASETPSVPIRGGILLISTILAWFTYRVIEKPIRSGRSKRGVTAALFLSMVAVGSIGYYVFAQDGLSFRLRDRAEFLDYFENSRPEKRYFERIDWFKISRQECAYFDLQKYRNNRLTGTVRDSRPRASLDPTCFERDLRYKKAVLLWGDSHAQHLAPGLKRNLPESWQILQVASSACYPDINADQPSTSQCDQSNYFALETIKKARPDVVVIAQMRGHSWPKFQQIGKRLESLGVKRVVVLGPTPQRTTDLPKLMVRELWFAPRRTFVGVRKDVMALDEKLQSESRTGGTTQFVSVIDVFCDKSGCITYLGHDKKLGITSWDYGHLTPIASDYLARNRLVEAIVADSRNVPAAE